MSQDPRARRFFRILRRASSALTTYRDAGEALRQVVRVERAIAATNEALARVSAGAARQRGAVETTLEGTRAVEHRLRDLTALVQRANTSIDRLGIVALNVALEGARSTGGVADALTRVSEEVRALTDASRTAMIECTAGLEELSRELGHVTTQVTQAQATARDVFDGASSAIGAFSTCEQSVRDVAHAVRGGEPMDTNVAKALSIIEEHGSQLATALREIDDPNAQALAREALLPMLKLLEPRAAGSKGDGP